MSIAGLLLISLLGVLVSVLHFLFILIRYQDIGAIAPGVFFLALGSVPYVMTAFVGFALSRKYERVGIPLATGLFVYLLLDIYARYVVSVDTSSTAGVLLIFIPIYSLIIVPIVSLVAYVLLRTLKRRDQSSQSLEVE